MLYLPGCSVGRKLKKLSWIRVRGVFVADAPVECGFWPRTSVYVWSSTRVDCELLRNRPPFLGVYDELRHEDFLLLLI
jgi:hypothetical protein